MKEGVYEAAKQIAGLSPSYISVTYGADAYAANAMETVRFADSVFLSEG